jgi:thioredoxin:protein disulfide reductase
MRPMRTAAAITAAILVVAALAACGGGDRHGGSGVPWERSLERGLERAADEHKLVMVDFYAEWCVWCKRLDQTTYTDGDVQTALQGVVPVKLDGERQGREAAARYGVRGYPTILFLDAGGHEVARIPGYLPPDAFLQELRDILRRG